MKRDEVFTQRLMQSLYHIARCRHATFQDFLSNYGVTLHQFHLLLHIRSGDKLKVMDVSNKMMVSMPTASRMINSLCEMGLMSKKKEAGDQRSTHLELTAKGKKIVKEIRQRQMEIISDILENIPEEDTETFLEVIEKIAEEWIARLKREAPDSKQASMA
jgi:MarR family 2-MHQ and catechol resistance regulon transcriptional repressor